MDKCIVNVWEVKNSHLSHDVMKYTISSPNPKNQYLLLPLLRNIKDFRLVHKD